MSTLALPSPAFPGPPAVAIETRGGLPTRPPVGGDLVGFVGVVVAALTTEPAA